MNPALFAGVIAALLAASGASRRKPNAELSAGAIVALLIWLVVAPIFFAELALLARSVAAGDWAEAGIALFFVVLASLVLFPWPIVRALLIPLGRPRLAWALSQLSFWTWRRDLRCGAVCAGAWAALRARERGRDPAVDFLEARVAATDGLASVRWRLGGAGIVATGLLAELRGDRVQARRLLASAAELSEPTWPRRAMSLAWEWLCAEACERGAWREVEFLTRTAPVRSPTLELLAGVAARLTGVAPLPNDMQLRWRWLRAPNRLATRPLLELGLAAPAEPRPKADERPPPEPPDFADPDPLAEALLLHAYTLRREPRSLRPAELQRLAAAWDRALDDPQLERRVLERGLALASKHTQLAIADLRESVRNDLLALILGAGLPLTKLGDDSPTLGRAARELERELLDALEISARALEGRVEGERELPAIEEWRAFLAVRDQYAEAVELGGLALRRLAFQEVHGPICSLAVWLWNDRSERALGNAMFHWLLAEAVIVDDAEAVRLQERNVDCGV